MSPELLALLDRLPLECDGMTRVVSTLLQRDGVTHLVQIGTLTVFGVGYIPFHWWITLPDGRVIDLRARMWLNDHPEAPHGLVKPNMNQDYRVFETVQPDDARMGPALFRALTEKPMDDFPVWSEA